MALTSAIIAALQTVLLLSAALTDITSRLISNRTCLALAIVGITGRLTVGPVATVESLVAATCLFLLFLPMHSRGWIGGGDVKLFVALSIGFSLTDSFRICTVAAWAGGGLAMLHLVINLLP